MADTNTPNIGLLLPDLGDTFNFALHVENNFSTIDSLMGAVQCTSSTRPSNTYAGQIVYETDSRRYAQNTGTKATPAWTYMSHAALSVTSATHPTSGLSTGEMIYETDTKRLQVYNGSAWEQKAFASYTCTSSTRPGSPFTGMDIFETDTSRSMVFDGANWVPKGASVMGAPAFSTTNGATVSSSTVTFDTTMTGGGGTAGGYYQVSLVSGRRYRVTLNGANVSFTVTSDVAVVSIWDSQNSSNPTSASAQVVGAQQIAISTGGVGRMTIPLQQSFLCTVTGTHTFGVAIARTSGTGSVTLVNQSGVNRELYVEDMGAAY